MFIYFVQISKGCVFVLFQNLIWKGANQYFVELSVELKILKYIFVYSPFHKTLPRTSSQMHWISVRFYEMGDKIILFNFDLDLPCRTSTR